MAAISAKLVKELRELTGVGMMNCKQALVACDGDKDKAIDWLREKGLAAQTKKAGKVAAEGVSYAMVDDNGVGVVLEVNSQTDFVAKNDIFQAFVKDVALVVAQQDPADVEALKNATYPGTDRTVDAVTADKVLSIGENIQIRRFVRYADGVNVPYVHMNGKIGVLVNLAVEGIDNTDAVVELGKDLAMQIAAMSPTYVSSDEVPADEVEKEKAVQLAKALEEGAANTKLPEAKRQMIAENKVKGRMNNYFAEVCLLNQGYVKENKTTVDQHVKAVAKQLGGKITVVKFTRFVTGEGIEKKEDDFAAEVASMIK
ncbi:MAG: translation elongation factor Ts [Clostridiales bacterium]|nr:translation elongation factor Ts [Clostridiales bacterium]MCD7754283.1 translation elongation factor Ts [Clostridiales bacterium]